MARPLKDNSAQLHQLIQDFVEVWSKGEDHQIYLPPQTVVEKIKLYYRIDVSKVTVIEHYRKLGIEYDFSVGVWHSRKE